MNSESVPYIKVDSLSKIADIILLDTREKAEYDVSHLKNAIWVGYNEFEIDSVLNKIPNAKSKIVVYCSIGVRSEDVGEKLQKAGYSNISNLYGGIFEWKNEGKLVYDTLGNETEQVHAYNKNWGKLLTAGEKVYNKKKAKNKRKVIINN
ncbi:rhodanese-like domain-containing protein [Aurantibacter crassamenti]|nr:rhodanese-like domain-containing protein [Aurantibacter crassamenti]MBM1104705.1 rhodanese-like domain-containing protein [Aurantibacter crassamenti]